VIDPVAPVHAAAPTTAPTAHPQHRHRGPANAWFFDRFDRYLNHISRRHKEAAFADIQPGRIVELGAGTGANIRHLPVGSTLVAVEPNSAMHERLRRRTGAAGIELTVLAVSAEDIPLPDDSVDEVICSLLLCTADRPDAVLAEVRRILRPGGRFRFVEHVAAPSGSPRRRLQTMLAAPWRWLFEGCELHRHTVERIEAAGFADVVAERRRFRRSVFVPVNTAAWGIATA
jgi:ubiquinone/menaquinone biosynthesis C-methylase UbiE